MLIMLGHRTTYRQSEFVCYHRKVPYTAAMEPVQLDRHLALGFVAFGQPDVSASISSN